MANSEIITSKHYPAYILASAGTGKTELIARKVENLIINEGVDIDKIALITFTNKATAVTTARIKSKLYNIWKSGNNEIRSQIDKISMAKISTIHTFCDGIIRNFSYEIGLNADYRIANLTLEKDKLANEIVQNNYDKAIFEIFPVYKIVKLLKSIEENASDKGIEIALKQVEEKDLWDKLRNYFYKVYPIYVKELTKTKFEQGVITTNDLIKYAVKILENKHIAPFIINSLEYLFLDEAQDINFEQAKLIELLISYGVKVFVVGDAKQSIYGFRGSDRKAFEHLLNYIKEMGGKMFALNTNFRANKYLVEKVNNLFDRTFKYKHNQLNFVNQTMMANSENYDEDSIKIKFQADLALLIEQEKMAVKLENGKPINYNNIAVLCRTNREVVNTYNKLKDLGVPVQLSMSKSIYKSKIVQDICKLFNYIVGGGELEKAELFYTDFYVSAKLHNIGEQEFYDKVDNSIITFKQDGLLLSLSQNIENFCLFDYYSRIDDKQAQANLQRFSEILRDLISENLTSMEILKYLNLMIISGQEEGQPQVANNNAVVVSTIHNFKGLDSHVIIVNEVDNNLNKLHFADFHFTQNEGLSFNKDSLLPIADIDIDKKFEVSKKQIILDNLEEEVRLMYVAMTRAKSKLILISRKPLDKVKYQIAMNDNYVSYLRWIYNI